MDVNLHYTTQKTLQVFISVALVKDVLVMLNKDVAEVLFSFKPSFLVNRQTEDIILFWSKHCCIVFFVQHIDLLKVPIGT